MTTSAWRIALLAVLLLPTRSFAEHQSFEIESLRIIIDTDWPGMGAQGYFPVRMDITNLGDVREIEILVTGNRWIDPYRHGVRVRSMFGGGLQSGRTDLRQILRLKRGDRLRFTMPLPVFADSERFQIRFRENGRYLDTPNSFSFQSGRGLGETPVLLAVNPSSQLGLRALGWPRPVPYTGYRGGIITTGSGITVRGSTVMPPSGGPRLDYTLSPERLPTNWLGFTSLRAVLLGPAEWQQLNAAQQDALLTWTASGGDLLFVDGTLDALLPPGQTAVGVGDSESVRPYFLGNIHLLNSIEIENVGFPTTIDSLNSAVATPDWSLPAARASDWGYIAERGFRFPIEGAGIVPSRAYLSILSLFVLLIGPLNYLYLWRKRRPVLMVVTVPLISIAFIGLLTGYGLLSEGFGVRARAVTFTVLDQNSKKAATHASASLYPGGITPGEGVSFTSDTAVLPIGIDGFGTRADLSVDLTGEQRFQSGFLQPRTPSNFDEVTFQPARQRLNFERNGAELNVVNGLGAKVRRLYYRENGETYALNRELPAGDRAPMQAGSFKGNVIYGEGLKGTPISPVKFQQLVDRQPDGSYFAILETSPFWDPGLKKTNEAESFHLVFGIAGGQP